MGRQREVTGLGPFEWSKRIWIALDLFLVVLLRGGNCFTWMVELLFRSLSSFWAKTNPVLLQLVGEIGKAHLFERSVLPDRFPARREE